MRSRIHAQYVFSSGVRPMYRIMYPVILVLLSLFFSSTLPSSEPSNGYILVVGGAGFIGSHVNQLLYEEGYQTVVLDNLSTGNKNAIQHGIFIEGDIENRKTLDEIFSLYPITAVMHFAGLTQVGESVSDPLKYYINNVTGTLTLLQAMKSHSVNLFIFSSSAAIYGLPCQEFITEEHPKSPMNPYGQSKLMIETILQDLDKSNCGFRYCALRYFNAAGGDPRGKIKNYKQYESNLIPIVLRSIQEPTKPITIFGTDYETPDGTAIRDYIHVEDLATAHIAALNRLYSGAPSACYNLGNGKGFSVLQVISTVEKVTGRKVDVLFGDRRAGDPPTSIASSKKANLELGWHPQHTTLDSIIRDAWNALN